MERRKVMKSLILVCIITFVMKNTKGEEQRPKRNIKLITDLFTSTVFGVADYVKSKVAALKVPLQDTVHVTKLLNGTLIYHTPKYKVYLTPISVKSPTSVVEVVSPPVTKPVVSVLETYLGTKTSQESVAALDGFKNLIRSGILAPQEVFVPIVPKPPNIVYKRIKENNKVGVYPPQLHLPIQNLPRPFVKVQNFSEAPVVHHVVPEVIDSPFTSYGVPPVEPVSVAETPYIEVGENLPTATKIIAHPFLNTPPVVVESVEQVLSVPKIEQHSFKQIHKDNNVQTYNGVREDIAPHTDVKTDGVVEPSNLVFIPPKYIVREIQQDTSGLLNQQEQESEIPTINTRFSEDSQGFQKIPEYVINKRITPIQFVPSVTSEVIKNPHLSQFIYKQGLSNGPYSIYEHVNPNIQGNIPFVIEGLPRNPITSTVEVFVNNKPTSHTNFTIPEHLDEQAFVYKYRLIGYPNNNMALIQQLPKTESPLQTNDYTDPNNDVTNGIVVESFLPIKNTTTFREQYKPTINNNFSVSPPVNKNLQFTMKSEIKRMTNFDKNDGGYSYTQTYDDGSMKVFEDQSFPDKITTDTGLPNKATKNNDFDIKDVHFSHRVLGEKDSINKTDGQFDFGKEKNIESITKVQDGGYSFILTWDNSSSSLIPKETNVDLHNISTSSVKSEDFSLKINSGRNDTIVKSDSNQYSYKFIVSQNEFERSRFQSDNDGIENNTTLEVTTGLNPENYKYMYQLVKANIIRNDTSDYTKQPINSTKDIDFLQKNPIIVLPDEGTYDYKQIHDDGEQIVIKRTKNGDVSVKVENNDVDTHRGDIP